MTPILDLVTTLADLVLPQWCAGCGRVPGQLCAGCRARLSAPAERVPPRRALGGPARLWAAAHYDGPVRAAVLAYKERGRRSLAGPLGTALARSVAAAGQRLPSQDRPVLLVPVPPAGARLRERGYDPLGLLVREALRGDASGGGVTFGLAPVLRHTRAVADQAALDARHRAANVAGALTVPPGRRAGVAGRVAVVVDDVLTTGATLGEAARALRAAGARVHAGAVLAATPRSR